MFSLNVIMPMTWVKKGQCHILQISNFGFFLVEILFLNISIFQIGTLKNVGNFYILYFESKKVTLHIFDTKYRCIRLTFFFIII